MATWGTNGLTNRGRVLQNKAQAGVQLKYTKIVIGDGQLGNQSIGPLLGVISPKMTVPITRLRVSGDSALIGMTFNNDAVTVGFTWRELGIYAQDPDLGEIMYFYANAGTTGSYIPPGGGSDIVEMSYDQNVFVGTAQNITAEINESLVYATRQELDEVLQESKTYTDTQIANVKVPDASTTQKGIVQLDNTYTSNSVTTAPTSRALTTAFNAATTGIYKERGNVPADWNTATSSGSYTVNLASWTGYSNYPANAYSYGKLSVFSGAGARVQVYYTHDNPSRSFWRVGFNDTDWRPWTQVVRTGPNAFTDDSIVFTTPVPLILKRPGIKSWVLHASDSTRVYLSPSSTPDATDWNFSKGMWVEENNIGWAGGDLNSLKQSASDVKTNVANAITGKGGTANSGMTGAQLAAAITNLPVKRFASGTFNGQSASSSSTTTGASMNVGVNNMNFMPSRVFIRLRLKDSYGNLYIEGYAISDGDTALYGRFQNRVSIYSISQSSVGFTATINSTEIRDYAGAGSIAVIEAFQWFAYE